MRSVSSAAVVPSSTERESVVHTSGLPEASMPYTSKVARTMEGSSPVDPKTRAYDAPSVATTLLAPVEADAPSTMNCQ